MNLEGKKRIILVVVSCILIISLATFIYAGSFIPPGVYVPQGIAILRFYTIVYNDGTYFQQEIDVNLNIYYFVDDTAHLLNTSIVSHIILNLTEISSQHNASGIYVRYFKSGYTTGGTMLSNGTFYFTVYNLSEFLNAPSLRYVNGEYYTNYTSDFTGNTDLGFKITGIWDLAIIYDENETIPNSTIVWFGREFANANITLTGAYIRLNSTDQINVISQKSVVFYPYENRTVAYIFYPPDIDIEIIRVETAGTVSWQFGYGTVRA